MMWETAVEGFSLFGEGNASLHFEQDPDLLVHCGRARRGGTEAALVLVELGIDGAPCHRVRTTWGVAEPDGYDHDRDPVKVLTDAIAAMEALRDNLQRLLD